MDKLLYLVHIRIVLGGVHALNSLGTVRNSRHYLVSMTNRRIGYVLVLEVGSVGQSFAPRRFNMAIVSVIMLLRRK